MKNLLLLLTIFIMVNTTIAQIKLSGVVKDSIGTPLEMANIIAINKQTKKLDSYGFSDTYGNYKLNLQKNSSYTIKASYVGMKSRNISVSTKEIAITKNIILDFDNTLDEIEIISKMPVTVKGDTIVYNADSFKNGTEKKLEDVLKKLPGVEVNDDGEIEVDGQTVTKVMVEGKDFFDGDSKLATQNIPSNAIEKIEVLKNHSEVSQLSQVTDNEDNIVINLKLKEGKKSFWFGEVTAGVGLGMLDERYLIHPKLFYYNPKYSVNIITDFNNIGEIPFTRQDYFKFTGGFRGSGGQGTNFNVSSSDIGFLTLQNNKAKEIDTRFGAVNFSYSPKKNWDLSGFAIYSGNDIELEENTTRNYFQTDDSNLDDIDTEEIVSNTLQKSDLGLIKLSSSYKKNTNSQLDYDVFAKISSQKEYQNLTSTRTTIDGDESVVPISQIQSQNPFSINQNLNYYYTLNEKNIFSFEAQHFWQKEDPFYNAQLASLSFADQLGLATENIDLYDVSQNKNVFTNKVDAKLDYYYVLNDKSNLNITLGTTLSNQQFDSDIFQFFEDGTEQEITDETSVNDVDYSFNDFYGGLHYKFIAGIFTFNQGVTAHKYNVKNTQLGSAVSDDFVKFLPDAFVKIALKKTENIQLRYSQQVSFTNINSVAEGYVFDNYNQLYSGNRYLESALSHNASLNYFNFNLFNYTRIFARLNYNKKIEAIKGLTTFDGIDQIATSINSEYPDETVSANLNYQRSLRKFKVSLGANLVYSVSNNLYYSTSELENINRESNSFTQSYKTRLSFNFKNAPNFDIGYNVSINKYSQESDVTTLTTHSPFINFETLITDELIFTSQYTYNNYRNQDEVLNNYSFWDADLTYQKKDSKWEYKIGVTNLLSTETLNQDSTNDIYNSISSYVVQPRYATFSVKYNL